MPNTRQILGEDILADLRRLDYVRRLIAIDDLKRQLGVLERRTQCEMPGHLRWKTPQWRDLRRRCFERDKHRCTTCGRTSNLRMHHLKRDYRRVGMDGELQDVTTRCGPCHSWVHRYTNPARLGPRRCKGQTQMAL